MQCRLRLLALQVLVHFHLFRSKWKALYEGGGGKPYFITFEVAFFCISKNIIRNGMEFLLHLFQTG